MYHDMSKEEIKKMKKSGKELEKSAQQYADRVSEIFNSLEPGQSVQSYISKKVSAMINCSIGFINFISSSVISSLVLYLLMCLMMMVIKGP